MSGYRRLFKRFATVRDPRARQGRDHILSEVLFLRFVAVLAGNNNAEAVLDFLEANEAWFREIVLVPDGIPAHGMLLRALALVNPDEVERVVRAWVDATRAPGVLTSEGRHAAFDGKTLRGSLDKCVGFGAMHRVGAHLIDLGLTQGTVNVDDKANKITPISELVRVNLKGTTVTIDAMGCQTGTPASCGRPIPGQGPRPSVGKISNTSHCLPRHSSRRLTSATATVSAAINSGCRGLAWNW